MPPGRRKPERNDLDRQRKGAEPRDDLGRIRDDDHPLRGGGDDLLAQQRAAAALDQPELGIDLVGTVDRQIELWDLVQKLRRNAERLRLRLGRFGSGDAANVETGRDPLPDEIDEMVGGRTGAEAEPHPGRYQFERALGRL